MGAADDVGRPHHHFSLSAVVGLTNVLFFVVVQTVFFWYIASRSRACTPEGQRPPPRWTAP